MKKSTLQNKVKQLQKRLRKINREQYIDYSKFKADETWSLDITMAKFILPRIKEYDRLASKQIEFSDEYKNNIQNIIKAFEMILEDESEKTDYIISNDDEKFIQEQMISFGKLFRYLWW